VVIAATMAQDGATCPPQIAEHVVEVGTETAKDRHAVERSHLRHEEDAQAPVRHVTLRASVHVLSLSLGRSHFSGAAPQRKTSSSSSAVVQSLTNRR
jgi:hypothetical protein